MRLTATLLCVFGATLGANVQAADSLAFLHGEWHGSGTLSGAATSVRQSWQPALHGAFASLQLQIHLVDAPGDKPVFEGTGYYRELADHSLSGVWVDSNGNVHPLRATLEASTLTVLWGTRDTESGRSVYQLRDDGSLTAIDSVEDADGAMQQFASAKLVRKLQQNEEATMAKVTGIGGVFMLARKDAKSLAAWYHRNLGMQPEDFGGVVLQWQDDVADDNGITVWHIAEHDSEWFSPSESRFMINYRVDDLDAMIDQLQENGVAILQGPESHENGKFAWIMDPEGNKVELWEPMLWDDANKDP